MAPYGQHARLNQWGSNPSSPPFSSPQAGLVSVRRLVAGTAGLFCIIACSLFLLPPAAPPALASPPAPLQLKIPPQRGDRNLQETLVFPQDVLSGSGGRVIDITRPPYNARGDGVTDNTQAFLAVYDDILAGLERHATGKSIDRKSVV